MKARRALLDLTQRDLVLKAGVLEGRYWKIENGYIEPTDDERAAIADALNTTVDELFPMPQPEAAS